MKTDPEYKAQLRALLIRKGISRSKLRDVTGFNVYRYLDTDASASVKQLNIVFGWLNSLPDKE